MKQFQLIAIFLLIISTAKGQQDLQRQQNNLDLMKKLLNQNFKLHKTLKDTANIKELLAFNNEQKPIFLYETEKGKVYVQPLDNMRYLDPSINSNMPVIKEFPQMYIPNAIHREK